MNERKLHKKIESLVADLRMKIEQFVPDSGSFAMVYSEFRIFERNMTLTDVMLKLSPMPNYIPGYETDRWLELVGYKLPVPIKSTILIFKGSRNEVLRYMDSQNIIEKIKSAIPVLDYNLMDV